MPQEFVPIDKPVPEHTWEHRNDDVCVELIEFRGHDLSAAEANRGVRSDASRYVVIVETAGERETVHEQYGGTEADALEAAREAMEAHA